MGVNKTQDKQDRTVMERLQHKRGRQSREELQQLQAEKAQLEKGSAPLCTAHPDCHAWSEGRCMALADNDFGGRDCPFYKNRTVNMEQCRAGLKRLIRTGRSDLLQKYRKSFEELGLFDVPDADTAQAIRELEQYSEEYLRGITSSEVDEFDEADAANESDESEAAGGSVRAGGMAWEPEEDEWDD